MDISFASWETSVHNNVDQIKRIASAKSLSASKIVLDQLNSCASIVGSSDEPYTVTLDSCNCFDFASRQLPCKHIYRLALELGYLDGLPTLNKKLSKTFDTYAEISRFYDAYQSGIISIEKFVKIATAIQSGK